MYTQKNYLVSDLLNALAIKVDQAKARVMGDPELRIGNDGRAVLCVKVTLDDGLTATVEMEL